MDTQDDVTLGFSQNMPYPSNKRQRTSRSRSRLTGARGTSRSTFTPKARTSFKSKIWPYQKRGSSQLWDPFPSRVTAILRYNETVTITPTAGLAGHYLFSCNSIFDPNVTGTGHQPYGRDSYAAIYNHYKVNSSTIVITPTENFDGMIGCTITDDTSVNSSFDTVKEVKNTVMKAMGANGTPEKVVQYYNKNQVFGDSESVANGASFGSGPSEQSYFDVWACGKDSSTSDTFTLNISISYNVSMWELKDLGQS